MAKSELPTRYDHTNVEEKWYEKWESEQAFAPEYGEKRGLTNKKADPFCIVIPPPNVTGQLHVGHALNHTLQDVLTRWARKTGRPTLWLPGTDHAGIATQSRVEKELKEKENVTRHELGREKFLEKVWDWKHHYGNVITSQMRKLGESVDWSRLRFTMDDRLSRAVRKVFVDLYKQGLIYRDTRMVNWDPAASTVLSDLEVEYTENHKGELWEFAYPLEDGNGEIVVATTRPETMLGDTGIAVHPDDGRYKNLIGKKAKHPLVDRLIPIIADEVLVDPEFGTGAVKLTPAHDPNDFESGKRHNLEMITVLDEKGAVNENGGEFKGLDRFEARKKVKAKLAELGLERGSKEHTMSIGKSQRSGAVVEPMISTQWFVKVAPLAEKAIEAVENKKIQFYPKQWENLYFSWMREIRDWCISRQLWWGHQIPAWHCGSCGHVTVSMDNPDQCESCSSDDIERDPDVLDTWFSSGLWPFSTMGWPEKTKDMKTFHPGSVLVTAYDIIFFWVARMIMLGEHFTGEVPFHHVYIHGLMRDEQGRKISKSLGNNIDPVEVMAEYGTDSYRFFLTATLSEGKDSVYSESRLKGYQNFANKIWNSSRFVLMNLPDDFKPVSSVKEIDNPETEDWWILDRLSETSQEIHKHLETYKFHLAADSVYTFVWNDFCDWYIELIKPRMFGKISEESKLKANQTAFYVLDQMLGLLHPFMPFLTEELYAIIGQWKNEKSAEFLMWESWPAPVKLTKKAQTQADRLKLVQEVINRSRFIRGETRIAPDQKIKIIVATSDRGLKNTIKDREAAILRLAQAESIEVKASYKAGKTDIMEVFSAGQVFVPLEGIIDIEKELARLKKEIEKTKGAMTGVEKKLANEKFLQSAPVDVVEKEKRKLEEMKETVESLEKSASRLGG